MSPLAVSYEPRAGVTNPHSEAENRGNSSGTSSAEWIRMILFVMQLKAELHCDSEKQLQES